MLFFYNLDSPEEKLLLIKNVEEFFKSSLSFKMNTLVNVKLVNCDLDDS